MFNKSEKIRMAIWIIFLLYSLIVIGSSYLELNVAKANYEANTKTKLTLETEAEKAKEMYELDEDAYVEKKAREQLGYQYPDEKIFRSIN